MTLIFSADLSSNSEQSPSFSRMEDHIRVDYDHGYPVPEADDPWLDEGGGG